MTLRHRILERDAENGVKLAQSTSELFQFAQDKGVYQLKDIIRWREPTFTSAYFWTGNTHRYKPFTHIMTARAQNMLMCVLAEKGYKCSEQFEGSLGHTLSNGIQFYSPYRNCKNDDKFDGLLHIMATAIAIGEPIPPYELPEEFSLAYFGKSQHPETKILVQAGFTFFKNPSRNSFYQFPNIDLIDGDELSDMSSKVPELKVLSIRAVRKELKPNVLYGARQLKNKGRISPQLCADLTFGLQMENVVRYFDEKQCDVCSLFEQSLRVVRSNLIPNELQGVKELMKSGEKCYTIPAVIAKCISCEFQLENDRHHTGKDTNAM